MPRSIDEGVHTGVHAVWSSLMVVLTVVMLNTTAWGQIGHGISIQGFCNDLTCVGESTECLLRARNVDEFDDAVLVFKAWSDLLNTASGPVRIPADPAESLPLNGPDAIQGNAVAVIVEACCLTSGAQLCSYPPPADCGAIGGSLQTVEATLLGQPGSTYDIDGPGGPNPPLPGDPSPGQVVFVQDQYVVQPGDPEEIFVNSFINFSDQCDVAGGAGGCSDAADFVSVNLVIQTGTADVTLTVNPSPDELCVGDPTEVTFDYTVTTETPTGLEDVVVIDDACGSVPFIDGDDGDGILDPGETWLFQCTATVTLDTPGPQAINPAMVTGTAVSSSGCLAAADVVSTVTAFDSGCVIEGPDLVCPGASSVQYDAVPGDMYEWTISGSAVFCDGTTTATGSTVCVDTDPACPGEFTLVASIVGGGGCEATCTRIVTVNDEVDPTIACPPDLDLPPDVPSPAMNIAEFVRQGGTISDNCPGVMLELVEETTTGDCPTLTIRRRYRATDRCGNTADCIQTIITNCPEGPCCFGDGTCAVISIDECVDALGIVVPGDTCEGVVCLGACCFPDGSCMFDTRDRCAPFGGVFQGPGTVCQPNPCPALVGACCFPGGLCAEGSITECTVAGGVYAGHGTTCDQDPCGPPLDGACCLPGGGCEVTTERQCSALGGDWKGAQTLCSAAACPCPSDVDGSGDVGLTDLLLVLVSWGPCPVGACPIDLDGSGSVDFGDLLRVLGDWGPCPL